MSTIETGALRSNIAPAKPYYYVQASLDLSGARTGDTLYFNLDNSLSYLTKREYTRFIILNENVLLGEVMVRTRPVIELLEPTMESPHFWIGGAADTQSAVMIPWAAPATYGPIPPPGFSGRYLTLNEINANPINPFGHTSAVFPYGIDTNGQPNTRADLRYLSISILPAQPTASSETVIKQGTVEVTVKVYPKDTFSF
jgi:hypothetical protein